MNSLKKLEYVVPIKCCTKKKPFCMASNKLFLKDVLQDSCWVSHSVMKSVGAVEFQKIKSMREGKNDKSDNFEMGILDKGALDKALTVSGNTLDRVTHWGTNY